MENRDIVRSIKLEIISASGLPKVGPIKRKPKAAVTIKLDSDDQEYQTNPAPQSTDPEWKDESFIILQRSSSKLDIAVKDDKVQIGRFLDSFPTHWEDAAKSGDVIDVQLNAPDASDKGSRRSRFGTLFGKASQNDQPAVPASLKIRLTELKVMSTSPNELVLRDVVERAQRETAFPSKLTPPDMADMADIGTNLGQLIQKVAAVKNAVDVISKVHPYAETAWKVITAIYHVVEKQQQMDTDVGVLVSSMHNLYKLYGATENLKKIPYFEEQYINIFKTTSACGAFIHWYTQKQFLGRVGRDIWSQKARDQIDRFVADFKDLKTELHGGLLVQISSDVQGSHAENAASKSLLLLPQNKHHWDSTRCCLADTRIELLGVIDAWINSQDSSQSPKKIFWLYGSAGSGKSSIATTLAMKYYKGRLGAYFFFARGSPGRSVSDHVFYTMAHELALYDTIGIQATLVKAAQSPNVQNYDLVTQVTELFQRPLEASKRKEPMLVILDGLDECDNYRDILYALGQGIDKLPAFLRLLITSRPETQIADDAQLGKFCQTQEIDITSPANMEDIGHYVGEKLQGLLSNQDKAKFLNLADGLFIWASTACGFIGDPSRFKRTQRLGVILEQQHSSQYLSPLYSLYATALKAIFKQLQDDQATDLYMAFLGTIVVLQQPVKTPVWVALARAMGIEPDDSEEQLVTRFSCVIGGGGDRPLHVHHASFLEFVTVHCQSLDLRIYPEAQHESVFRACLKLMEGKDKDQKTLLRYNICDIDDITLLNSEIPDLAEKIHLYIPAEVQYACQFWVDHCSFAKPVDALANLVFDFLRKNFLHWLEAMSLMGKMTDAVKGLGKLKDWALMKPFNILSAFMSEAHHFAQTYFTVMAQSAFQIYHSALPFCPTDSAIFKYFATSSAKAKLSLGRQQTWPAPLLCLEGHTNPITCVCASRDGSKIVSGSADGIIHIWDTISSGSIFGPLAGPSKVTSVCFSNNGHLIASGYENGLIKIWNVNSAKHLQDLSGHEFWIRVLQSLPESGSSNSSKLLSASSERICLWDCDSGEYLWCWKNPNNNAMIQAQVAARIFGISMSSDGDKLICCFGDMSIYMLNPLSGDVIFSKPGPVPQYLVNTVNIASGADWIVTRPYVHHRRDFVSLWKLEAGTPVLQNEYCAYNSAPQVAVSQDGTKTIFASSQYGMVSTLDLRIRQAINRATFKGYDQPFDAVAFFPDESRLVASSRDTNLYVWATKQEIFTPSPTPVSLPDQQNPDKVFSRIVAPDGSKIASSIKTKLILWEPRSNKVLLSWKTPLMFKLLAFSWDGSRIAARTYYPDKPEDAKLYLLDIIEGRVLSETAPSKKLDHLTKLAFSLNGSMIATGSAMLNGPLGAFTLWNATNWEEVFEVKIPHAPDSHGGLEGIQGVGPLAFSHDGSLLSVVSTSCEIHTYGTAAPGDPVWTWRESEPSYSKIGELAYSSDGSKIVACIENRARTVLMLDAKSGQCIFTRPSGHIDCPEFPFQLEPKTGWVWFRGKRTLWLSSAYRSLWYTYADSMLFAQGRSGEFIIIDLNVTVQGV